VEDLTSPAKDTLLRPSGSFLEWTVSTLSGNGTPVLSVGKAFQE